MPLSTKFLHLACLRRAARALIGSGNGLSAEMPCTWSLRKAGTNRILSFDRGYDTCPGVERLE